MKSPDILFIVFFAFSACALTLGPQDSLDIMVSGGASIVYEKDAGAKGLEDGLLRASLSHALTNDLQAIVAVRGSRNSADALLEEGALSFHKENYSFSWGFVSNRMGFAELYRPHSIFYFLFDKALLWDVNGFGLDGGVSFKNGVGLNAGSSLNSLESGQAFGEVDFRGERLRANALVGFQSYETEDQDNSYTEGANLAADLGILKIHGLGKFMQYMGFGHSTNSTMVPGESFDGLFEARIDPADKFNAEAQIYYKNYHKSYQTESLMSGIEATWMVLPHCGIGAGYEYQMDDSYCTNIPRLFLVFVPFAQKTEIRLSFQQSLQSGAQPVYSLFGEIWMQF